MDDSTKARLVGASIFTLAGLIVLPVLFGDPVDPRRQIHSRFAAEQEPLAIAVVTTPTAAVRPSTTPISTPSPSQRPRPSTPTPRPSKQPVARPQTGRSDDPHWRLQLASYRQEDNAASFARKLRDDGLEPRVVRIESGGKPVWRVQVRLQTTESRAKALQARLNKKYRIKSVLSKDLLK